jgi:hypothetical protein
MQNCEKRGEHQMSEPTKEFTVTIHPIKGDPIRFKLRRTVAQLRDFATNLEGGLQARYAGVELNGKLMIVPFHNVRSVEIDPAPGGIIMHVIRDAERVDD